MLSKCLRYIILNAPELVIRSGYLICTIFCLYYLCKAPYFVNKIHLKGFRILMILTSLIFFTLLIFNLFEIPQTIMNAIRITALNNGWYESRHTIQIISITGICAIAILFLVLIESTIAELLKYNLIIFYGLSFLIFFYLINNISIHFLDQIMNFKIIGLRFARIFELSVISLMTVSSIISFLRLKKKHNSLSISTTRYI
jgi:hypothetical protein